MSTSTPPVVREIPGPEHIGPIDAAATLLEFTSDWRGFFWRRREQFGSTVFRMHVDGNGIAVTDRDAIWSLWNGASVRSPYGFGPRRPWPAAIRDTLPMVYSNDDAHARRKLFFRALIRRAAGRLEAAVDAVLARYLPRWTATSFFDWSADLDSVTAEILFEWLLGATPPPTVVRTFEVNVVPIRLINLPMPADISVRHDFDEIVAVVRQAPLFHEAARDLAGLTDDEAAHEIAFTLCFNGYGALSGAVQATMGELSRHPLVLDGVREELRAAWAAAGGNPPPLATVMGLAKTRDAVREAIRLHPPAPIMFREAREDFTLLSRSGAFTVRKGELLWGVIEVAQRDPVCFAEPEEYRPERFADPAVAAMITWADGPPAPTPAPDNRQCVARDEAQLILQVLLTRLLPRYRWVLTEEPEWGKPLVARNLPTGPLRVESFFPEERAAGWTAPARPANWVDELRTRGIAAVRALHEATVEHWSRETYRTQDHAVSEAPPEIVSAASFYGDTDMPSFLRVAKPLPASGRMSYLGYVVPYYITGGAMQDVYALAPIPPEVAWTPNDPANELYPVGPERWGSLQDDDTFARLRLSGPNPFLLTRLPDRAAWVADYGPYFEGIAPPVSCEFHVGDAGLAPTSIRVGDAVHTPGDSGWPHAKRLANALDARLAVFGQHLLFTHFVYAQAFALARFTLAPGHALRAFAELHTYGSLEVNHYAYLLLLLPASYFVQSGFILREQAIRLFENAIGHGSIEQLIPPRDLARRGLAAIDDGGDPHTPASAIPGHPYAEDAPDAWAAFHDYASAFVERVYPDDAAVAGDAEAQAWHAALVGLLPNTPADMTALRTRADLSLWLAACVYANVAHKVAGDFSQYTDGTDPEQMSLLDFARVLGGLEGGPVALNAVALMKQGAYASQWSPPGNMFFGVAPDARTEHPALREENRRLQPVLERLDALFAQRNAARKIPFLRMQPRAWELSVGF